MARFIHFIDDQKRDAQVTFSSLNPKAKVRMVLPDGSAPESLRVIKGSAATSVGALCDALIGPANEGETAPELVREIELAEHLIKGDPEVDMELHGKFITIQTGFSSIANAAGVPPKRRGIYLFSHSRTERTADSEGDAFKHIRERYGTLGRDVAEKGHCLKSARRRNTGEACQWINL